MDAMIIIAICLFLYFLPAMVAGRRYHKNLNSIFVLNLFLGWTILGWVGSMVWALSAQGESDKSSNGPEINPQSPFRASSATRDTPVETPFPTIQFPDDDPPEAPLQQPPISPTKPAEQDWVAKARQEIEESRKRK